MPELIWFEFYPPRGLDLVTVTGLLRTLASRRRRGLLKQTPIVVFEAWALGGHVRWTLGVDAQLARSVPKALRAQLPRLGLIARPELQRPAQTLAGDVRLSHLSFPLRLDTAGAVSAGVIDVLDGLHTSESAVLQWVVGPVRPRKMQPVEFSVGEALGLKEVTPPDASERQSWKLKTTEPLLAVRGRIGASAATPERTDSIIRSLAGALALANSSHAEIRVSTATARRARDLAAAYRQGGTWSSIVNAAELGVLLGLPLAGVEVPGIGGGFLSPAPQSLVMPSDAEGLPSHRVLGSSLHPADGGHLVTMPLATSTHHVHVIGPTGSGKSNELAQLILADAHAGHGVLVVEPRGDLVEDVLARMPEHRRDDVVVIDPADDDQVGWNPLAGPTHEAERRADELVNLFRELFGTALGPRSTDVLLHATLTAARMEDGTLADVPALLTNPGFRRRALAKVSDPLVLAPWWVWFDGVSDAERQQIIAPINNKLRTFLSRQSVRRMLGQPQPNFSLDDLFVSQPPRVVLVNLNRGVIGPEAGRLLGSLLLTSAWQAAQRRATLPKAKRFPVMWVIDEFQDYVGALDFGDVLAQARGLGVGVTCAHQQAAQLSPNLRAAVTANARSRLAFRPSQDDVKSLAAVFGPAVTAEDLERLGKFQACIRLLVDGQLTSPFTVKTLPLPPATTDAGQLRRLSRERYAMNGSDLDKLLLARWQGGDQPPDGPIGTKRRRSS